MDSDDIKKEMGLNNTEQSEDLNELLELLNSDNEEINILDNNDETSEDSENIQGDNNTIIENLNDTSTEINQNTENLYSSEDTESDENISIQTSQDAESIDDVSTEINQDTESSDNSENTENIKKPKKINFKINLIYITIAILSIFIIITIGIFSYSINYISKKNNAEAYKIYKPIKNNIIYLDITKNIDNMPFLLEKIVLDYTYSLFYLKTELDISKYSIYITDDSNNLYTLTEFSSYKDKNNNTLLKFDPINSKTKFINLVLKNLETNEVNIIEIKSNFEVDKTNVKYIDQVIIQDSENISIEITNGTFTPKISNINYIIKCKENSNFSISQGFFENNPYIDLNYNKSNLEKLQNKPIFTNINDKLIIGSMDFNGIPDANSKFILSFDNLYKNYKINKTIPYVNFLSQLKNNELVFGFDKYKLFIDGFSKLDDKFIISYHGEDTAIPYDKLKEKFNNRVKTIIDAEIVLTGNGEEIILKPTEIISEYFGTDMIFDINQNNLKNINLLNYNVALKINSVVEKISPEFVYFDLNKALNTPLSKNETIDSKIIDAFTSRLDYKFKNKSIKGFSDELKKEILNSSEYKKSETSYNLNYDIKVISKYLNDDKFYAIVKEAYFENLNGEERLITKLHKISGQYKDGNLIIQNDKQLN